MSGHSKWATIKRKKGAMDAKRGQLFTRLAREIVLAAREGGGDPEANVRLRLAIEKARANNMPKENIERAIKRGTGESKEGGALEQVFYEGYAPHGVALMIECVTENRNRTVAEIRHVLTRAGGSLGEAGSVAWQFKRAAYFALQGSEKDFEKIFEVAVEAGADDVTMDGNIIEIVGPVESFKSLLDGLRGAGYQPEEAGLRMIPTQEIELGTEESLQVLRAIEALEDLDDVQNVYHNLRITDEALMAISEG
ncbi:MAG: YebC/PmpR family DNA-binding transcriptional regulator [Thermanaerothrix sp.]|jgi:YebC/PmpR family DNA-binding regulatory protein|uniref:Probable transcriptional regulatory protein QYE77_04675 n=1 Tax=Thermanaerothrix solaris TaxID=3058434 RepID=A0ABU3NL78_9CHLR|nr:YebC/PmpR family DNA-binding transcriptional regulator [Thermanaerothrix sp. 4228-RoL]MDT8897552.1 YebC/PmpR family DNA-binding transcriptional regulator [Thermanaerothrix sp. 4228-RoL]